MIDAVIFDMDGLMFDSERVWDMAWGIIVKRFGLTPEIDISALCRGKSGATEIRTINEAFGIDYGDKIAAAERDLAWELMPQYLAVKPGLEELIDWLDARRIPYAVATSSDPVMMEYEMGIAGVLDRFGTRVSGFGLEHGKPAPDIFLNAAAALGTRPERTLVLEDSVAGVQAGHDGGFVTVMVPDLTPANEQTRAWANATCATLLEVRDLLVAGAL